MKKKLVLITLWLFIIAIKINAQNSELWGTTFLGGTFNAGSIFKINEDGTGFYSYTPFSYLINGPGRGPLGNLAEGTDGKLYGTTFFGGTDDSCVLYSYVLNTGVYTMLHDFDPATGYIPAKGLLAAPDGKLYGTTVNGGTLGWGVLYSYDPTLNSYNVVHNFDSVSGWGPYTLPLWINNKLYGTTRSGGMNGIGVIYSFDVTSSTYSVLHDFNIATGFSTYGDLVQGIDGKIYGSTDHGGANNKGVIFSYDIPSNTYMNLYDININTTVSYINHTGLIQSSNGKLYGMISHGGIQDKGIIFSFDITSSAFEVIHNFDSINGQYPSFRGKLFEGNSGKLFGTTYQGGDFNKGVIFNFDITNNTFTKMLDFNGPNGAQPTSGFVRLSFTTNITQHVKENSLAISPNPATNQITINSGQMAINEIEIYDTVGRRCLTLNPSSKGEGLRLDVSSFDNGIYFVKAKTKVGIVTQKIIVQH